MSENNKQLPDTPWHVGFVLKEDDDPRRDKRRCIHYRYNDTLQKDGICNMGKSGCFMRKCPSSSHCAYYAETYEQAKLVYEMTMTAEEEAGMRIEKVRASMQDKMLQALKDGHNPYRHKKMGDFSTCFICHEPLGRTKGLKRVQCRFCGALYVNRKNLEEADKGMAFAVNCRPGPDNRKKDPTEYKKLFVIRCTHEGECHICTEPSCNGKKCGERIRSSCSSYKPKKMPFGKKK